VCVADGSPNDIDVSKTLIPAWPGGQVSGTGKTRIGGVNVSLRDAPELMIVINGIFSGPR